MEFGIIVTDQITNTRGDLIMKGFINVLYIALGICVARTVFDCWLLLLPDSSSRKGVGAKGRLSSHVEYFAPQTRRRRADECSQGSSGKRELHPGFTHTTDVVGAINKIYSDYHRACELDQASPSVTEQRSSAGGCVSNEEGAQVMPSKYQPRDVIAMMMERFPGREHYWVSRLYEPLKNSEIRQLRSQGRKIPDGAAMKPHHFFVYAGFIDSMSEPTNAHCWRSVSCDALSRLILAEDPGFVYDPDRIPEARRRFRF